MLPAAGMLCAVIGRFVIGVAVATALDDSWKSAGIAINSRASVFRPAFGPVLR